MAISRLWFNRIPSVGDSRSRDGDGRVDQVADVDNVLAPVACGGLNSGLCLAAQALLPRWPSLPLSRPAPWMRWTGLGQAESYRSHAQLEYACPDGLRASLGELTLPIFRRHMTRFFGVGQEEILQAMRFAHERLKLVIERSSAVALVPLLRQGHQLVSKRVGVMLTGGNVEWLRSWPRLDMIETIQQ